MALSIRRYEPADAEAVWTVHELALRASPLDFVEDAPADADLREITESYLDADGEFLVGTVEGAVVAIGGFRPVEAEIAELRRMRVHPDHQRNGYGGTLLSELEARAEERGFDALALKTHEALTAARALYEAWGYERTGSEPHPATDDRIVHYRKPL